MTDALERIQNEVARENGYSRWHNPELNYLWPEVCRRYALECCKATLAKASENADVMVHPKDELKPSEMQRYVVDKSTVTDKENIVIL